MKTIQLKSFCSWAFAFISLLNYAQTNIFPISGNVGIGTLNPNQKLTIKNGGIGFDNNSSDKKLYSPADGDLEWMTHELAGAHGFAVSSQGAKKVYLNANGNSYFIGGNVGIGTVTPTSRLTVNGAGGYSIDMKVNGRLQTGDATNFGGVICNAANTQFVGQVDATRLGMWNDGWRVVVENNGNVGIGTTNSANRLSVVGAGGYSIDLKVNGRLQTGDATNFGGVICNAANSQFVGQVDATRLGLWNDGWALVVGNDGKVAIGNVTTPAGYKLSVETGILTEKVKVALKTSTQWADHVFSSSYKLKSLTEVEAYLKANNHLEGIPSADELVKEGGIDMNIMFAKQMEKIEELTLYVIGMKKEIEVLKTEKSELKSRKTNK